MNDTVMATISCNASKEVKELFVEMPQRDYTNKQLICLF